VGNRRAKILCCPAKQKSGEHWPPVFEEEDSAQPWFDLKAKTKLIKLVLGA